MTFCALFHHRFVISTRTMKGRVLITEVIHPVLENMLSDFGFTCTHIEEASQKTVLEQIANYEGLIVRSKVKADKTLIDKGSNLQFIGRTGSGMELIDVEYAHQKGITCFNSPEGNCDSVAEQAVGMLLALLHNIVKSDAQLRHGIFNRLANTGAELMGKTVGIIGYGNTGAAFAKRLQGFGVKILAYDKYKTGFGGNGIHESTLPDIFNHAHIVSLHIPLTPETHHWVNEGFVMQFKQPPYLINTSRGAIVQTTSILHALETHQLKGFATDVLENENLHTYTHTEYSLLQRLSAMPNVVLTPHTAGLTHESAYKIAQILAGKIIHHYSAKTLSKVI